MNMKQPLAALLLGLSSLAAVPALAEPEQHRHGQEAAAAAQADKAPAPKADHDMAGMDDMKSGGKPCKKGMGGGDAANHDHDSDAAAGKGGKGGKGGMGMMGKKGGMGGMGGKSDGDAMEARVHQLEKRLDLMQHMLEMLIERRAAGAPAGTGDKQR